MDLARTIQLYTKESKSYEDLKELDTCLQGLVEDDSRFNKLSQQYRFHIINSLKVIKYRNNDVVFEKGDPSDCLYIILSGSLKILTKGDNGINTFERLLTKGTLGERGILKNKFRSLTAVSVGVTYLLRLDAKTFKKYLYQEFIAELTAKKSVVEKYIPCIDQFSDTQKEKIAYSLKIQNFRRGNLLLKAGCYADSMMIVLEGECSMVIDNNGVKKTVAILENGSLIGEDTVFNNRNSYYNVIVSSESVKIAVIKLQDVRSYFPSSFFNSMRQFITQRNTVRNRLVNFSNPCLLRRKIQNLRSPKYSLGNLAQVVRTPEYISGRNMLKSFSFSNMLNSVSPKG
ncbi:hypothetical protein SteCoe_29683 [Stentor coeruleus]|uniref:Cyclic nucleotide-binding domain-containing protein n=1 Tax=Stentor coeruleus TaxID=5963 RepID=A0A1R2B5G0_9CILI|nr:hypothetical protein SteCoe_29683 [Stentor coeruleus]